jgi:hypothetical protein
VEYFTGRLYEYSSLAREELSTLATPLLCPLIQRAADVVLAIGLSGEWLGYEWSDKNKQRMKLQPSIGTESCPIPFRCTYKYILDSRCLISYHRIDEHAV